MSANFWDSVILITSSDPERMADRDFGTGFVINQDEQTTYVLTCAHVVIEVGGSDKVRVGGHPATVEALGDRYGCDLAVLAIKERLTKLPPLKLSVVGEKGRQFSGIGFYTDGTKTRKLAEIRGKLGGTQIIETTEGDRTKAWNLDIDEESEHDLKSGYSGSPVIEQTSGYVLGVVAQLTGKGKGLAISIEVLAKVWSEIPHSLIVNSQKSYPGEENRFKKNISISRLKMRLQYKQEDLARKKAQLMRLQVKIADIEERRNLANILEKDGFEGRLEDLTAEYNRLKEEIEKLSEEIEEIELELI
jgi:S1-C subfamily serine protease